MAHYTNAGGVARKVTRRYANIGGVARSILKAYTNAGGAARLYFGRGYSPRFQVLGTDNPDRTLHDSYAGADGNAWRFYLDSTGAADTKDNPHRAVVTVSGDLGGKVVTVTARRTTTSAAESDTMDAAKVTWWSAGSDPTESETFLSEEDTTRTFTLPPDAAHLRLGVWLASAGTAQMEMVVTQLEIGGETLI